MKRWRQGAGLVVALVLGGGLDARAGSSGRDAPTERFALVVGNNGTEDGTGPALRYADDDAVSTFALLRQAGVKSVLLARLDGDTARLNPEARAAALPRGAPFDAAIAALFADMEAARRRGNQAEFWLFYSGHGDVAAGEGYVLLEDRRLTRSDLHALLARSPAARNHVFVDACKSYFLAFAKAAGGHREPYLGTLAADSEPARLANVGFVLSTSSDRDSHEWERFQAGVLSHEVRSALRGAADADGDGRITYAELGAFLGRANASIQNPRFRPDFLVRPPGMDLHQEVFRWGDASAAVRVAPQPVTEHLYVENGRGQRLLDTHAGPDQRLVMHLPAERPLFLRKHDETAELVIEGGGPVTTAHMEARSPAFSRRGALQLAFEQLFATPFGPGDVAAFERQPGEIPGAAEAAKAVHAVDVTEGVATAPLGWRGGMGAVALPVAVGATAVGLALDAGALWRYQRGAGASQAELSRTNLAVRRLYVASVVCYGVAAIGAALWGWSAWERHHVSVGFAQGGAAARGSAFTLSWVGAIP